MKTCSSCKVGQPVENFAFRNKAAGTRRAKCKFCVKEWDRNNYERPERAAAIAAARKKRKQEIRDLVWRLKHGPCADCKLIDPVVMEFDHLEDKEFNISVAVTRGFSDKRILAEVAKCELVCANCHRRRTHRRAGWVRNITVSA